MDDVFRIPVENIAAFVKERERILIESEDAMFVAARDRAATDEERAYWNELTRASRAEPD